MEFKINEILTFDIYGTIITGKFMKYDEKKEIAYIETISDSSYPGMFVKETQTIHVSHLIKPYKMKTMDPQNGDKERTPINPLLEEQLQKKLKIMEKKTFAVSLILSTEKGQRIGLYFIQAVDQEQALGTAISKNWAGTSLLAFNVREVSQQEIRRDNPICL